LLAVELRFWSLVVSHAKSQKLRNICLDCETPELLTLKDD
jgi:hypothetical protein